MRIDDAIIIENDDIEVIVLQKNPLLSTNESVNQAKELLSEEFA